jgi:hypothetical protein
MKLDPHSGNSDLLMGGQLSAFRGPPPGYFVVREPFFYQVPISEDLASLGTQTVNLLIQADSDFEWTRGAYSFTLNDAQKTWNTYEIPNYSLVITDTGSGRQMSNAAVPVTSLFGLPGSPLQLPITKVFKANSNVAFTITNFDAATATGHLRLTLLGWKLYYFQGAMPAPEQAPM